MKAWLLFCTVSCAVLTVVYVAVGFDFAARVSAASTVICALFVRLERKTRPDTPLLVIPECPRCAMTNLDFVRGLGWTCPDPACGFNCQDARASEISSLLEQEREAVAVDEWSRR